MEEAIFWLCAFVAFCVDPDCSIHAEWTIGDGWSFFTRWSAPQEPEEVRNCWMAL